MAALRCTARPGPPPSVLQLSLVVQLLGVVETGEHAHARQRGSVSIRRTLTSHGGLVSRTLHPAAWSPGDLDSTAVDRRGINSSGLRRGRPVCSAVYSMAYDIRRSHIAAHSWLDSPSVYYE